MDDREPIQTRAAGLAKLRAVFGCVPGDKVKVEVASGYLHGTVDMVGHDRNGPKLLVQWLDGNSVKEQWFPLIQCWLRTTDAPPSFSIIPAAT